ncbi:MAG: DNA translocase FtsK 4TM domain-containing protein [Chloroflexi bacterium]|nr:DNA translocase FtsK 4TM domain-containing protein [Chloroflexota bacterium]
MTARRGGPRFRLRLPCSRGRFADILALVCVALGIICSLALVFPSGQVTGPIRYWMGALLGWTAFLVPVWLIAIGLLRLLVGMRPDPGLPSGRLAGAILATLALPAVLHLLPFGDDDSARRALDLHEGGGALGFYLSTGLEDALGYAAAMVVLLAALALGLLLIFDLTLTQAAFAVGVSALFAARVTSRGATALYKRHFGPRLRVNRPMPTAPRTKPIGSALSKVAALLRRIGVKPSDEATNLPKPTALPVKSSSPARAMAASKSAEVTPRGGASTSAQTPTGPAGNGLAWRLPPMTLLTVGTPAELSQADVRAQARIIEETLQSFNIQARVTEVNSGPTVTQFGLEPGPGVAVNRIMARNNDLALRLGASALRLEAPVPGRRVVGVEVPNRAGSMVSLRELLESDAWAKIRSKLRLALGRDVSGHAVIGDLARMPHLLIAGATGSGKSVCINSIIASLICQSTPDELQFVMIDPKMVELVNFNGIPHLRMPVVTDMERVVGSLKWVVREMERRYALFAKRSARNIEAFNKSVEHDPTEKRMPFLVVVIDELADMMMTAGDEVERILCRLAQLARATGIHLVVATQRPSVDVITGLIKANFPTRISFAVSSHIDSRTILDTAGAEKLLGRGDMLFLPQDSSKPVRVQGAFVSDEEMQRLVEFWRTLGPPRYSTQDVEEIESLGRAGPDEDVDELVEKAADVATQYRRISTSLLQRRLGIGYPRAARLVDLLEERGIVGPSEDGKSREVLEREPLSVDS